MKGKSWGLASVGIGEGFHEGVALRQKVEGGTSQHHFSLSSLSRLWALGSFLWLALQTACGLWLQNAETHFQKAFVAVSATDLDCGQKKQTGCFRKERDLFQRHGELTKSPGGPRTRFSRWAGMREAGQQDTRGAAQRGPSDAAAAPEPGRHSGPHIHTGTQESS